MVDIEIGVLAAQCLDRRIESIGQLTNEITASKPGNDQERSECGSCCSWIEPAQSSRRRVCRGQPYLERNSSENPAPLPPPSIPPSQRAEHRCRTKVRACVTARVVVARGRPATAAITSRRGSYNRPREAGRRPTAVDDGGLHLTSPSSWIARRQHGAFNDVVY